MYVRHSEDGSPSSYRGYGVATSPGDVVEVDDDVGEVLLERIGFVRASEDEFVDEDGSAEDDSSAAADDQGDAVDDDGSAEREDVDEWNEWTADAWLELDYEARAEDVLAGSVDEHLDDIEDAETSENVKDAVEERREELAENDSSAEVTDLDDVELEEV